MEDYTPNQTDAAAKLAITEQQQGDEFKPQPRPEAESLLKELSEIEYAASSIYAEMYQPMQVGGTYKGPDYLQRERMVMEIDKLESRARLIKHELNGIAQMGATQS